MPHQIKIARGSRFLCGCGCKTRKTNPRRRFAPGHDRDTARRNRMPERGRPAVPSKKVTAPRSTWSPEPNELYEAVVDVRGYRAGKFLGFYFAILVSRNERCFVSCRLVPRMLEVGEHIWVKIESNDDNGDSKWVATQVTI